MGSQLEAVLVQLPPDFAPDAWKALAAFVELIPAGPRVALEVRDPHWFAPPVRTELLALLRDRGLALAVSDGPFVELNVMVAAFVQPTAPFGYIRWLGRRDTVTRFDRVTVDRAAHLMRWADALRAVAPRVERVCGYANNQYMGHSPATLRAFMRELGVDHTPPPRWTQTDLFA